MVSLKEAELAVQRAREVVRGELPEDFAWVGDLSRTHLMQFAIELYSALARLNLTRDNTEVLELFDSWETTAELDAAPEIAAIVKAPQESKEYVDWFPPGQG
jgi:hypothetical protein